MNDRLETSRLDLVRARPRASQAVPSKTGSWPAFARFPNFVNPPAQDIEASLNQFAELLAKTSSSGTIALRIVSGAAINHWTVHINPGAGQVSRESTGRPDIELVTTANTWMQIASGNVSPLQCFAEGRLRFRGDVKLAKRFLEEAASTPGALVDIC